MFELAEYIDNSKTYDRHKYTGFAKKFSDMFQEPFIVKSAKDEYCEMIWSWFESYDEYEKNNKENGFIEMSEKL